MGSIAGRSVLRLAPWRRAPLLLLRRRSVLAAVLGAALVLGAAAAASPLFLSSVGSAALTRQLQHTCIDASVPYLVSGRFGTIGGGFVLDNAAVRHVETQVRSAVADVPNVRPAVETLISGQQILISKGKQVFTEQLLARDGFLNHITVVAGGTGPGVWLTDDAARFLGGVRPGDTVTLAANEGQAAVRVKGIYHNLADTAPTPYWCAERSLIYPPGYGSDHIPPMLVLADHDEFLRLQRAMGNVGSVATWELPLVSDRLTLSQARAVDAAMPGVAARLGTSAIQGAVFFGPAVSLRPNLPHLVDRATETAAAVRGAVSPAAVAGAVVALLLVGAAGSYWVDRRRPEVRLLAARGVGPAAIGVKAALEMGLPTLVGGGLGLAAAYGLVRGVGPSSVLEPAALAVGAAAAVGAAVAGVLLLGTTAALRATRLDDVVHGRHRVGRVLRWVPWELGLLAAAWWTDRRLAASGGTHLVDGIAYVNDLALAFPLLFLAGAVGLLARAGFLVLWLAREGRQGSAVVWYLARRRLTAAPHVALVMLVAAALPIGTLVYSAAVTRSVSDTVRAKVDTFAGSDYVASFLGRQPVPKPLAGSATRVVRSAQQALGPGYLAPTVDVLGVDPATFARGAYWTGALGHGSSLPDLLTALAGPGPGGRLPAVLVGTPSNASTVLYLSDQGNTKQVPLDVVKRLPAFPGQQGSAAVVVDRARLQALTRDWHDELWVRGDPVAIQHRLDQLGVSPLFIVDRDRVLDASSFLAVSWTFGFLGVIAVLTGVIAVGGLLLYLESRTRSRVTSYVLSRRMGLRRAGHFGSLVAELGVLLGAGLTAGVGLAWAAAYLVHGRLDVAPSLLPGPLLAVPVLAVAGVAAASLVVVLTGAAGSQLSADRARPAEVMRFDG